MSQNRCVCEVGCQIFLCRWQTNQTFEIIGKSQDKTTAQVFFIFYYYLFLFLILKWSLFKLFSSSPWLQARAPHPDARAPVSSVCNPDREILQRVVLHVACYMLCVYVCVFFFFFCAMAYLNGPRLLDWSNSPPHLQFNRYVLTGYRPISSVQDCIRSLFYLHNELGNIYTHGECTNNKTALLHASVHYHSLSGGTCGENALRPVFNNSTVFELP